MVPTVPTGNSGFAGDHGGGGNRTRERFLPERKPRQGWVYLIHDGGWSYKIGYARDPAKRLALLQTGSVEQLRIVAVINAPPALERELHELFAGDRIRGEWFHKSRELLDFFADNGFPCTCRGRNVDAECFIHGGGRPPW